MQVAPVAPALASAVLRAQPPALERSSLNPDPLPSRAASRPFFHLRDRREKTSAIDPRAPARAVALRSEDRKVSLAQAPSQRPPRPFSGLCLRARLSVHQDRSARLPRASIGVVLHDRPVGPADDRSPRSGCHKQPLEQSAAGDRVAKRREQTSSAAEHLRV
jgi:hypothetical protein